MVAALLDLTREPLTASRGGDCREPAAGLRLRTGRRIPWLALRRRARGNVRCLGDPRRSHERTGAARRCIDRPADRDVPAQEAVNVLALREDQISLGRIRRTGVGQHVSRAGARRVGHQEPEGDFDLRRVLLIWFEWVLRPIYGDEAQVKTARYLLRSLPLWTAAATVASGLLLDVGDLHHLHFFAVLARPVHLEDLGRRARPAGLHPRLDRSLLDRIVPAAGEGADLLGVTGTLAHHEAGGHAVGPGRPVLAGHVVVAHHAVTREGRAHHRGIHGSRHDGLRQRDRQVL